MLGSRELRVFLLTTISIICITSYTIAYVVNTYAGMEIKWRDSDIPVTYYINQNGTPDVTGTGEFTAIQNAYQTWTNITTSYMVFTDGGLTPSTAWGVNDGINLNVWFESNWAGITGTGSNVIAVNNIWFSTIDGHLLDSDIAYNGENFVWSSIGELGKMDVQNIATHEIGHSLSLGDLYGAEDTEKTMYGYASYGEIKKRTLHIDDIAGITHLYPTGVNSPPTAYIDSICPNPAAEGDIISFYGHGIDVDGTVVGYSWKSSINGQLSNYQNFSTTSLSTGTHIIYFKVQDNNSAWSTEVSDTLVITTVGVVTITTNLLSDGWLGVPYSQTLTASGGVPPYSWSIISGSLPPGLSLNSNTGAILGTPTAEGTFSFTVRVADSDTPPNTDAKSLSITIKPTSLTIITSALPDGWLGVPYSQTLSAIGGVLPYNWLIVLGSLPQGLNLNSSTGLISGMPTALGTSSFIVKVTDSDSLPNADTKLLSIVINLATPTLIAPEDSTIINDDTPTFVWSSTTGEYGSYTLEYTPDSTFASGVVTVSNLTDTIYTVYDTSTLSDTTYWWHVEAVKWPHSSGYQKHPSMFTVDTKVPETPILILPKDSLITNCDTIIFLWSAPEEGLHYLLQCATDVDYNLVLDTLLIDTTLTVILSDATYYWHVKAIDRAGNESEYQEHHFTFTIDTDIPNTPVLISPANSSYVNVSTPTFIWSNAILKCSDESSNLLMDEPFPLSTSIMYCLQIAMDTSFTSLMLDICDLTDTAYTVTCSLLDTTYYWHVEATDQAGNRSGYQDCPFMLIVDVTPPSVPTLITPEDRIAINDPMPTLIWSVSTDNLSGTEYYILQYADNSDFFDAISVAIVDTVYTIPDTLVLTDTIYYWHVKAVDIAMNESNWSDVWSFMIDTYPPSFSATTIWVDTSFQGPYLVTSIITDALSGVDSAFLFYRFNEKDWQAVSMRSVDSLYEAEIPEAPDTNITIRYYLKAKDSATNTSSDPEGAPDSVYSFVVLVGIAEQYVSGIMPTAFALHQNFPNPFTQSTVISYKIPASAVPYGSVVSLRIYDLTGRLVRTLVDEPQSPSHYTIHWDGIDNKGRRVTPGVYFYCLVVQSAQGAESFKETKKAILLQ